MTVNTLPRDYDIARMLEDYRTRIDALERAVLLDPVSAAFWQTIPGGYDTGWTNDGIVWGANWDDFNPAISNNHLEYRRIGPVVHWRGLIERTGGALSSATETMLTLPTAVRPSRNVLLAAMTNGTWVTGGASAGTAHTHNVILSSVVGPLPRVVFNATGALQVTLPGQMTINTGDWVTLGGISYPVEF